MLLIHGSIVVTSYSSCGAGIHLVGPSSIVLPGGSQDAKDSSSKDTSPWAKQTQLPNEYFEANRWSMGCRTGFRQQAAY